MPQIILEDDQDDKLNKFVNDNRTFEDLLIDGDKRNEKKVNGYQPPRKRARLSNKNFAQV